MGRRDQKVYVKHKSDLNLLIDNHFDTSFGPLTDKENNQKIFAKIGEQPESVIFIRKSAEDAKAAKETRITTILVVNHCRNIQNLDESDKQITRIRSFNELEFE